MNKSFKLLSIACAFSSLLLLSGCAKKKNEAPEKDVVVSEEVVDITTIK